MNSKIVLTIQKQLKDITNKKFSKKYINKNILPIINHIVSSDKKKILIIQPIHKAGIELLDGFSDYEYEIVEDNVIPTDRTFRNAWEYEAGSNEKTSEDL